MCGIAGFWAFGPTVEDPIGTLQNMAAALRHRGPDDAGVWWDAPVGIGLAHRRLAIIDLSVQGRQPMESASGRYVIVYNGEVYNFLEQRRELEGRGIRFRGSSDTEVMLAAIECRGLLSAVAEFAGMFSFALFDRQTQTLSLVRDRVGEKPLYYGWVGRTLLFGSELKALRAHSQWQGTVDRDALAQFLRFGYVPAPHSIFSGVHKVAPGTILTVQAGGSDREGQSSVYWSALEAARRGHVQPLGGGEAAITEELDTLLRGVVSREMIADVPLGAFLSGGVDSSLVVAIMQAQSSRPVRTFTIGFHERSFDEAVPARAVARHLGTEHTELYVTPAEALSVVPRLPSLYDEPFADASQIPTFLVAELARRHVTVSLSGDGADELFGGYERYVVADRLRVRSRLMPGVLRRGLARTLRGWSPSQWDRALGWLGWGRHGALRSRLTGERLHKTAMVLAGESDEEVYRDLMSHWHDATGVALGSRDRATVFTDPIRSAVNGYLPWMMYVDLVTYLPDDLLVKVDRAAMGVSLESRAPYLDHSVVEFAWRLPADMKVRRGRGKWILRTLLDRYVPAALVERPKMGFGVPLDEWLRGPLKDWAAALLEPQRIEREGYLDPALIAAKWRQHQDGSGNWQYLLWDVLMFQAWLEAQ